MKSPCFSPARPSCFVGDISKPCRSAPRGRSGNGTRPWRCDALGILHGKSLDFWGKPWEKPWKKGWNRNQSWKMMDPESSRVVKILESRMERDGKSWGVPLRSMVFFLIGIDVLPWNTCGFKLLMSEWKIIIQKLYEIMVGCSIGAYVWLCYYTFQYYL